MLRIKGVELDEIHDLSHNLEKVRLALVEKISFWTTYSNTVLQHQESQEGKAGIVFKLLLFLSLLPRLGSFIYWRGNLRNLIIEAEDELTAYYERPLTKVRRFRLKCTHSKEIYKKELDVIEKEIDLQQNNLQSSSIGDQTKKEISELLHEFKIRKSRKLGKYNFYQKCEEKLLGIEEQIKVKRSIEQSRLKLEELDELKTESLQQNKVQEEFELYTYYGDLLDSISLNMKRLEQDKEEQIEEEAMIKMLSTFDGREDS